LTFALARVVTLTNPDINTFSLNLIWSLADFWQVLIPLVAFVSMGADIT
jgi:hypothetical protein